MMSSIPARRAVPGATCFSAWRSSLSFRGSVGIECQRDRLPERRRRRDAKFATNGRPVRGDGLRRGRASRTRRAAAPPARPAAAGRSGRSRRSTPRPARTALPPGRRGDRERDAEVGARLVDAHAAGDVDEDVGLAERDARMAAEHGDDHREPLRVDAGADAARHREVGRRRRAPGSRAGAACVPSSAQVTTEPGWSVLAAPEQLGRVGDADEARGGHLEDAELVRRAEAVLHGAQDPVRAVAVALELRGRSRRGARARGGRRRRRPSSRDRRGRSRCPPPSRRAAAGPSPRAPGRRSRAPSRGRARRASGSSRSRRPPGARARASRRRGRGSSRRGCSTSPAPPSRSARSLTCAADSSPVTSATVRAGAHGRAAPSAAGSTCRSRDRR